MLPEIYKYCNEKIASVPSIPFKGLRNYTLLLSACNKERGSFEQEISPSHHRAAADTIRTLNGLPNTTVLEDTKLDAKIVKEALATSSNNSAKHKSEIRVVVSGPGPYNAAIRSILVDQCFRVYAVGWDLAATKHVRPTDRLGTFALFCRCLLYTSPSPRDAHESRMPSSA